MDASLRRLRTDYVDLYQVHSPDPETPLEETLQALDDLVRSGKARYVGCSNYPAWELAKSLRISERHHLASFECVQPRFNLLFRDIEMELLPLCRDEGIGVICYNPMAGGMLSGKYRPGQAPEAGTRFSLGSAGELYQRRYWHETQIKVADDLRQCFEARGKSLVTAAIAWVLQQPGITAAIVGASKPEQLDASLAASGMTLDEEEQKRADEAWYQLPRRPSLAGYR